jgi:hypothetical protein
MSQSDMYKIDFDAVREAFEVKNGKQPDPKTCCCYDGGYDRYFCEFCDWRRRFDAYTSSVYFAAKCTYENIVDKIGREVTEEHLQVLRVTADFTEGLAYTRNMLYELHQILEPLVKYKQ